MNKRLWIIANWKSNKTIKEALEWISVVGPQIPIKGQLKVVVCPPFSGLSDIKKSISVGNFPLTVGVQNISAYGLGAYTGEMPAEITQELASIAIVGHSERRQNFGETDALVAKKVKQAIYNKMTPLVCIQDEKTPIPLDSKLVAYEPVFAIGTGKPDTSENADKVAAAVKRKLSPGVEVLYGGSIHSKNVLDFITKPNLSGILVGKASLDAEEFIKICNICTEALNGF